MTDKERGRLRWWIAGVAALLIGVLGALPIYPGINNLSCQPLLEFVGADNHDHEMPPESGDPQPEYDEAHRIYMRFGRGHYCIAGRQRRALSIQLVTIVAATAFVTLSSSRLRRPQDEEEGTANVSDVATGE